ncbi:MAG: zinc ribbon domain-containing protein [Methanobrevibacter sp.]|nr:zinc ribbon domain-containing protein [Methanobrevibacter sp.]
MVFCPNCGFENKNSAKFCKNCGTPLITDRPIKDNYVATGNDPTARVDNSRSNSSNSNSNAGSDNKNLIIICLTVVICAILIAGALVLFSNNNSNDNSDMLSDSASLNGSVGNVNGTDTNQVIEEPAKSAQSNIKIQSGSFSTGSGKSDKTYCSVYVGEEHAGENVKISVLYSRDGSTLNNGNIVPKTVDSSGYVSVPSANAFKYYPDDAYITLYDSNGNILDTQEVYLSPESGKQTF